MGDFFDGRYTHNPDAWRTWTTTTSDGVVHPFRYGVAHPSGYIYNPDTSSVTVDIPGMWPKTEDDWHKLIRSEVELDKEDKHKVSVSKKETHVKDERAVVCHDPKDLSVEHILTTLSVAKGRLMMELLPNRVKKLECSVTPAVKQNIITAGKKLKMYGKEIPIIPHFDEWGNRLPDDIKIGDHSGIILKIVNPEDFGELYYELRATIDPEDVNWYVSFDTPL